MVCHYVCHAPRQKAETKYGIQGYGLWLAVCYNYGHTAPSWHQWLFKDKVHGTLEDDYFLLTIILVLTQKPKYLGNLAAFSA